MSMQSSEMLQQAEQALEYYKEALLIDPFMKISLESSVDEELISECVHDKSPLSWKVILNPNKHNDEYDVQYSIIESLLKVLFDRDKDHIENIIARLSQAICEMTSSYEEEDIDD